MGVSFTNPALTGDSLASASVFGEALQSGAFGEGAFSVLAGFGSALIASRQNADDYFSLLQEFADAARRRDGIGQKEILRRIVSGLSERTFLRARPYISVRLLGARRFDPHPERVLDAIFGTPSRRQSQRVDTHGAPIVEKGAVLMAGAGRSSASRTQSTATQLNDPTEFINIARMSEASGLWQTAHHGYIKALQLYLGMADVAGARMAYEGAGRMGMAALTDFFEKTVAVQIEGDNSKNLRENLLGLSVGLKNAAACLRELEILEIDELFDSSLARFIGLGRDFALHQTAALLYEITEESDILSAAKRALPELQKLFSLLHPTPHAEASLLLEYAEHQKTVEYVDLVFLREAHQAAVEYAETRVPAPAKSSLLAVAREAARNVYEGVSAEPQKKIGHGPDFYEMDYDGPRIVFPKQISSLPKRSLHERLEQARKLERLGGLENIQRALFLVENRDASTRNAEDRIAVADMLGRLHMLRAKTLFSRLHGWIASGRRGSLYSLVTVLEVVEMDFHLAKTHFSDELFFLTSRHGEDANREGGNARLAEIVMGHYQASRMLSVIQAMKRLK